VVTLARPRHKALKKGYGKMMELVRTVLPYIEGNFLFKENFGFMKER
jgi:hypothetical protein